MDNDKPQIHHKDAENPEADAEPPQIHFETFTDSENASEEEVENSDSVTPRLGAKSGSTLKPSSPEKLLRNICEQQSKILRADTNFESLLKSIRSKEVKVHDLERYLNDCSEAVKARRFWLREQIQLSLSSTSPDLLPCDGYNYQQLKGACCENVIGYTPIPTGLVGPLLIEGCEYYVPLATTEGTLIASTNRGCKALTSAGGVQTILEDRGMTRAPLLEFASARKAFQFKCWIEDSANYEFVKRQFERSSKYLKLIEIHANIVGRQLYLKFRATTGR